MIAPMSRLVVISNRLADPRKPAAGGLAVALGEALNQTGGLWFGWSGTVVEGGTPGEGELHTRQAGAVTLATVDLCREDHDNYYHGYSNSVLWPVFHYRLETPQFAWDCGAGSGQLTQLLAPHFDAVVATDISAHQLQHAPYFENVSYQVQSAEHTSFAAQSFDLITVAQAIHWFDFDGFYAEVRRTLRPDGVLAVIGYGLIHPQQPELQGCIERLYFKTLKGYWDAERRYIDEAYQTIPFPFEEITTPELSMSFQWSAAQLLDYLNTWSALKHYRAKNSDDPLYEFKAFFELDDHANQVFELKFPIFLRLGRLSVSAP